MTALYAYLVYPVLTLLIFILFAYVVFSWLVVGGVVSMHNPTARQIYQMLASVIEPLTRPIQRVVPPLGQLDLSVFILGLALFFARDWLFPRLMLGMAF